MDSRTQERVEQWDSRPFGGGYGELATLSENGFSGTVAAAGTWLFMLNGRVVGVVDGEIEDFEHATGTVYAAPDPAVPLLASMRERGGDRRGQYYTNETSLSEVDETLQNGSFTGYVELSEQVLSGDYYLVYYGGRRMAVAYIGNAGRLLTGDEAFERAADEVGIYEVVDVDVEVTDVPTTGEPADAYDPEPTTADDSRPSATEPTAETEGSTAEGAGSADAASTPTPEPDSADGTVEPESDTGRPDAESASVASDGEPSSTAEEESVHAGDDATGVATAADRDEAAGANSVAVDEAGANTGDSAPEPTSDVEAGSKPGEEPDPDRPEARTEAGAGESATDSDSDPGRGADVVTKSDDRGIDWSADREQAGDEGADSDGEGAPGGSDESDDGEVDERLKREERWRETRSIPSIDPAKTSTGGSGTGRGRSKSRSRGSSSAGAAAESGARTVGRASAGNANAESDPSSRRRSETDSDGSSTGAREERLRDLRERLERATEARDRLESKAESLESERDELRATNEELAERVEGLQAKVERLEAALEHERARSLDAGAGGADGGEHIPPERALTGTNLFVRYDTKSDATLEMAHEGDADRNAVASNLRLEHHTDFDDEEVSVTGRSFEEFLTSTIEFGFVDWLTGTLLFEIRDTGHADDMGDLYDVIPRIDRVGLETTISLDDEDGPDEVAFDVVAFDKMGTPLVAATLNDSREPAGEEMLADVEAAASAVKANFPDFGAAMVVTSSYFDPGALEVTEEATAGGFLSRGSKQSYVTLSRKHGYHLCLVESRSGGFHVTVPEL